MSRKGGSRHLVSPSPFLFVYFFNLIFKRKTRSKILGHFRFSKPYDICIYVLAKQAKEVHRARVSLFLRAA